MWDEKQHMRDDGPGLGWRWDLENDETCRIFSVVDFLSDFAEVVTTPVLPPWEAATSPAPKSVENPIPGFAPVAEPDATPAGTRAAEQPLQLHAGVGPLALDDESASSSSSSCTEDEKKLDQLHDHEQEAHTKMSFLTTEEETTSSDLNTSKQEKRPLLVRHRHAALSSSRGKQRGTRGPGNRGQKGGVLGVGDFLLPKMSSVEDTEADPLAFVRETARLVGNLTSLSEKIDQVSGRTGSTSSTSQKKTKPPTKLHVGNIKGASSITSPPVGTCSPAGTETSGLYLKSKSAYNKVTREQQAAGVTNSETSPEDNTLDDIMRELRHTRSPLFYTKESSKLLSSSSNETTHPEIATAEAEGVGSGDQTQAGAGVATVTTDLTPTSYSNVGGDHLMNGGGLVPSATSSLRNASAQRRRRKPPPWSPAGAAARDGLVPSPLRNLRDLAADMRPEDAAELLLSGGRGNILTTSSSCRSKNDSKQHTNQGQEGGHDDYLHGKTDPEGTVAQLGSSASLVVVTPASSSSLLASTVSAQNPGRANSVRRMARLQRELHSASRGPGSRRMTPRSGRTGGPNQSFKPHVRQHIESELQRTMEMKQRMQLQQQGRSLEGSTSFISTLDHEHQEHDQAFLYDETSGGAAHAGDRLVGRLYPDYLSRGQSPGPTSKITFSGALSTSSTSLQQLQGRNNTSHTAPLYPAHKTSSRPPLLAGGSRSSQSQRGQPTTIGKPPRNKRYDFGQAVPRDSQKSAGTMVPDEFGDMVARGMSSVADEGLFDGQMAMGHTTEIGGRGDGFANGTAIGMGTVGVGTSSGASILGGANNNTNVLLQQGHGQSQAPQAAGTTKPRPPDTSPPQESLSGLSFFSYTPSPAKERGTASPARKESPLAMHSPKRLQSPRQNLHSPKHTQHASAMLTTSTSTSRADLVRGGGAAAKSGMRTNKASNPNRAGAGPASSLTAMSGETSASGTNRRLEEWLASKRQVLEVMRNASPEKDKNIVRLYKEVRERPASPKYLLPQRAEAMEARRREEVAVGKSATLSSGATAKTNLEALPSFEELIVSPAELPLATPLTPANDMDEFLEGEPRLSTIATGTAGTTSTTGASATITGASTSTTAATEMERAKLEYLLHSSKNTTPTPKSWTRARIESSEGSTSEEKSATSAAPRAGTKLRLGSPACCRPDHLVASSSGSSLSIVQASLLRRVSPSPAVSLSGSAKSPAEMLAAAVGPLSLKPPRVNVPPPAFATPRTSARFFHQNGTPVGQQSLVGDGKQNKRLYIPSTKEELKAEEERMRKIRTEGAGGAGGVVEEEITDQKSQTNAQTSPAPVPHKQESLEDEVARRNSKSSESTTSFVEQLPVEDRAVRVNVRRMPGGGSPNSPGVPDEFVNDHFGGSEDDGPPVPPVKRTGSGTNHKKLQRGTSSASASLPSTSSANYEHQATLEETKTITTRTMTCSSQQALVDPPQVGSSASEDALSTSVYLESRTSRVQADDTALLIPSSPEPAENTNKGLLGWLFRR
ncbi:unnamed protein product [Amoebophrya sp. A25]|nr:unnamed protein product [Amoebophrya sp. A25]|eukprot:GSA25T00021134001.1